MAGTSMKNKTSISILFLILAQNPAIAEDYVVPEGVTVLNENQLLTLVIGNSFVAEGKWTEYLLPPSGKLLEGKLEGWDSTIGRYSGIWSVKGSIFCSEYDKAELQIYNNCVTTVLNGDNIKWFLTNGKPSPSNVYKVKLVPGNPKKL